MSRLLSSLLVFLPKILYAFFSTPIYAMYSKLLIPFSFKMHRSSHYSNDKIFTFNKKLQVNSGSFWQWNIALRVMSFLNFVHCITLKRKHISVTGSPPVLKLKGEKEPAKLSLTEKAILCQCTTNTYLSLYIYLGLTFIIRRWIK
jgi:hypothetical protein